MSNIGFLNHVEQLTRLLAMLQRLGLFTFPGIFKYY